MNTLVFDIETVPDVELGRRIYDLRGLDDESVAKVMYFKQKQERRTDFLPIVQHRIVVISIALRTRDSLKVFSLGGRDTTSEKDIVQRFFDGLERYSPELVSWNGSGFDLPVLHYRSLRYGIDASRYWETGDADREFRYNNYLSRFHWRHIDLMDVLSGYQLGGRASLEHVAQLLRLPGKLGMSGDQVWNYYKEGRLAEIADYCETDVLNTYLVYLRFQLVRGVLDRTRYVHELNTVEGELEASAAAHMTEFLSAWRASRDEV